jgi:hypothetical protein
MASSIELVCNRQLDARFGSPDFVRFKLEDSLTANSILAANDFSRQRPIQ